MHSSEQINLFAIY